MSERNKYIDYLPKIGASTDYDFDKFMKEQRKGMKRKKNVKRCR